MLSNLSNQTKAETVAWLGHPISAPSIDPFLLYLVAAEGARPFGNWHTVKFGEFLTETPRGYSRKFEGPYHFCEETFPLK